MREPFEAHRPDWLAGSPGAEAGGCPGAGPLSVAVLVELARGPLSGGQIKCWERLAEAAAALGREATGVDLTVYVLGDRERVEEWSPGVRFVSLRPVLPTSRFARRQVGGADSTDLSPYHPRLARLLPRHDLWHLTHSFSFAATAVRLARRQRRTTPSPTALVGSVHTDVPAVAAAYVRQLASGLPGPGGPREPTGNGAGGPHPPPAVAPADQRHAAVAGSGEATGRPGNHRRCGTVAAAVLRHRRDRLLRACDRVLVATDQQRPEVAEVVGAQRVSVLGRGVDRGLFQPDPSAARTLTTTYGLPPDRPRILFVGRFDASKRAMVVAEAVRRLRDRDCPAHLVVVGNGAATTPAGHLLGADVTLLGPLPQDELARVYAGCDVFAFPSRTETIGNVVAEAMASGLPVVLPAGVQTTSWLARPGQDGLVVERDDPAGWARTLEQLVRRPQWRAALGARAARTARVEHRSWEQVLTEDLLPVWWQAAAHGPARRAPAAG